MQLRSAALLLAVPALLALAGRPDAAPRPAAPPTFTLPAREGTAALDSLKGKVVLVDFWASWCAPCAASFPWMSTLNQRYADKGLAIVAINLDKDRALADAFLEKHPAPFAIAFDPSGRTAERWHVAAMPTTFLIGRDGKLLMSHAGFDPRKTGEVEALIAKALGS